MIPHWDLIPGEPVTLLNPAQRKYSAVFLFRDTIFACLTIGDERRSFKLRDDGKLRDRHGKDWTVQGQRETSRTELPQQPMHNRRDRWRNAQENRKAKGARA